MIDNDFRRTGEHHHKPVTISDRVNGIKFLGVHLAHDLISSINIFVTEDSAIPASRIIGALLPILQKINYRWCVCRATIIIKDPHHHSHCLLSLLFSWKMYKRLYSRSMLTAPVWDNNV
ncbi:hypothetical protein CHARACLAT_008743 [Characodon lateralis]|uniref:Uncharacterized protein n=1 Tax=Characodon lateralis TaxID=208331 RepID=A0ABU7DT65_9TELE|nr:hypothetical protein [Characodon lateralis]